MKVTYLASATVSHSVSVGSSADTTRNHIDPKTQDVLRHAAAIFMGDLSARELYASENGTEIKNTMEAISPDHPGLIGGALRNKALGILWAEQDHTVYEKKMSDLLNNVSMCVLIFQFPSILSLPLFEGTSNTSLSSLERFCKIYAPGNV